MKIAILGGTSHIAKGLILNFIQKQGYELFLFVRSQERMGEFMDEIGCDKNIQIKQFSELNVERYDVLINCVGISVSRDAESNIRHIFDLTEKYDNIIIDYLIKNPSSLYISFSSGAIFGTEFNQPVDASSQAKWDINNIKETDYYGIAKLNSEAKHRSLRNHNIVDLRVFGYFSRFIDLHSRYLISHILTCVKEKSVFITDNTNIVRDYIAPDDLFQLVEKCVENKKLNDVYDAYSLKPVSKFEIIDHFIKNYGMKHEVKENIDLSSAMGKKINYYSTNNKARDIGYIPRYTSLECIIRETQAMKALI
jgi:nucleoside-diphosphate-sugar epimerase